MARETYDNGISICRPMYYDYPEAKEAYDFKSEYMFGDQILVAPITTPMQNGLSTVKSSGSSISLSPPLNMWPPMS